MLHLLLYETTYHSQGYVSVCPDEGSSGLAFVEFPSMMRFMSNGTSAEAAILLGSLVGGGYRDIGASD